MKRIELNKKGIKKAERVFDEITPSDMFCEFTIEDFIYELNLQIDEMNDDIEKVNLFINGDYTFAPLGVEIELDKSDYVIDVIL